MGVQTVTTAGYGVAVPENTGARLLAALVMLLGIGFITVITAAITGTFVARVARQPQAGSGDPLGEHLGRMDERVERIEAALRERRPRGREPEHENPVAIRVLTMPPAGIEPATPGLGNVLRVSSGHAVNRGCA